MLTLLLAAFVCCVLMLQAAREGREDVVREWMVVDESGLDARDGEDYTAFHYAAQQHHLNVIMRHLVDNGAG